MASARVASASTFDSVTGTFPTIYGPGYQGPGHGTTTITAGAGQLTGADGLTLTVDKTETELNGTSVSYREVFTLQRSAGTGTGSSL